METAKINKATVLKEKIQLIDGEFTASEALDIITSVLDVKINFHKLHRLSICEGNSEDPCEYDTGRIDELMLDREMTKVHFRELLSQGKKLRLDSTINITVLDEN